MDFLGAFQWLLLKLVKIFQFFKQICNISIDLILAATLISGSINDQVQVYGQNFYSVNVGTSAVLDVTLIPQLRGNSYPSLTLQIGPTASTVCLESDIYFCYTNGQYGCTVSISSSFTPVTNPYFVFVNGDAIAAGNYSLIVNPHTPTTYTTLTVNGAPLSQTEQVNTITYYMVSVPASSSSLFTISVNLSSPNAQADAYISQQNYPAFSQDCNIDSCSMTGANPNCVLSVNLCSSSPPTTYYVAVKVYNSNQSSVSYSISALCKFFLFLF